jgi:hypothetical protein
MELWFFGLCPKMFGYCLAKMNLPIEVRKIFLTLPSFSRSRPSLG